MSTTQEPRPKPCGHPRFQRGCRNCQKYERRHNTDPTRRPRPAAPLTEYIQTHLIAEQGMTVYRIAQRSGIAASAVECIANGERTWVYPHVDDAIRGVTPSPPSPAATTTDPVVVSRIIDILAGERWSAKHIGEHLGVSRQAIRQWQKWHPTIATVDRLLGFYHKVENTPGPSPETARRLRRRCAHPVPRVGWYGDDITDPAVNPHEPVPAFVGRRMLRALAAMGWFPDNLQHRYPAADTVVLDEVMRATDDRRRPIPRWVGNLIRHAYDTLGDIPGPDMGLAAQARAGGWKTAAWWEGRDIQAPHPDAATVDAPERRCLCGDSVTDHRPDGPGCTTFIPEHRYNLVNVHTAVAGWMNNTQLSALELADVVWRLRALEYPDEDIAAQLRWGGDNPVDALKRTIHRVLNLDPRVRAAIQTRPVNAFIDPYTAGRRRDDVIAAA